MGVGIGCAVTATAAVGPTAGIGRSAAVAVGDQCTVGVGAAAPTVAIGVAVPTGTVAVGTALVTAGVAVGDAAARFGESRFRIHLFFLSGQSARSLMTAHVRLVWVVPYSPQPVLGDAAT